MPTLEKKLRDLPKVEFHRHLDGSVRFETIKEIARHHNLDLGVANDQELWKKTKVLKPMDSLETVLDCFWTTQKVLCSYESIKRVTIENIEDAFLDGVKLLELRFAPTFIKQNKSIQFDEIIEATLDGISEGMKKYPIQVGLLHILPRGLSLQENIDSLDMTIKYRRSTHQNSDRLVGLDMADTEEYDMQAYAELAQKAKDDGMGVTIHTGESTSSEHIRKTFDVFSPTRIGHGVKIWGDEKLIERAKVENIHFELCPTSNFLTNAVSSLNEHPFKNLLEAGLSISLNSDDPHLMNIDLITEYQIATDIFGLSLSQLNEINYKAIDHSFLDQDIKRNIDKTFF